MYNDWCTATNETKDLLEKLLRPDPDDRIGVQEFCRHPWIGQMTDNDKSNVSSEAPKKVYVSNEEVHTLLRRDEQSRAEWCDATIQCKTSDGCYLLQFKEGLEGTLVKRSPEYIRPAPTQSINPFDSSTSTEWYCETCVTPNDASSQKCSECGKAKPGISGLPPKPTSHNYNNTLLTEVYNNTLPTPLVSPPRTQHDGQSDVWTCAACTYVNKPLVLTCEICKVKKPAQTSAPPSGTFTDKYMNGLPGTAPTTLPSQSMER